MAVESIDTRDLVKELSELDDEIATLKEQGEDASDQEERAAAIRALFEEITPYAGDAPEDGIQLIREDTFEEYAEELADDIGAIDRNASWPTRHIDWKAAADELRQDYTSVEFDGSTWLYR